MLKLNIMLKKKKNNDLFSFIWRYLVQVESRTGLSVSDKDAN